jgi:hypothetical protein
MSMDGLYKLAISIITGVVCSLLIPLSISTMDFLRGCTRLANVLIYENEANQL